MIAIALRRVLTFAFAWWIAAEGNFAAWPLALIGIGAATAVSLWLLPPSTTPRIALTRVPAFLVFFIGQSLLGGVQVARLAFQPRSALQPGLLELPMALPPGLPRLLLTATLGLMPGTLGVNLGTTTLRIHVLDTRLPIRQHADILAGHIARLFAPPR